MFLCAASRRLYVRILHLAATTMECEVERALRRLLESRVRFDYAVVRQLSAPASPEMQLSQNVQRSYGHFAREHRRSAPVWTNS